MSAAQGSHFRCTGLAFLCTGLAFPLHRARIALHRARIPLHRACILLQRTRISANKGSRARARAVMAACVQPCVHSAASSELAHGRPRAQRSILCMCICNLCICAHSMDTCAFYAHAILYMSILCINMLLYLYVYSLHLCALCASNIVCICAHCVHMCALCAHLHRMHTYAQNAHICTAGIHMHRVGGVHI